MQAQGSSGWDALAEMLTVPHQVNLAGQFHASTMKLVRKQTELL